MCFRITFEKDKKKTFTFKDEKEKKPKLVAHEFPSKLELTDVYYDSKTGIYYSKHGTPDGMTLRALTQAPIVEDSTVHEKCKDEKKKKKKGHSHCQIKCYHSDMKPPSPAKCCNHKSGHKPPPPAECCNHKSEHKHGCNRNPSPAPKRRQFLLLEPVKKPDPVVDYFAPREFTQVNMRSMAKPPGRGYETKELAIQAAYEQGLVINDPRQTVQMMPGTAGGFFVVGVTDP
ncbi:hypothetical protein TWF481_011789 [Arthrobotrys musiformis]|uniref:Uncharacterized protein n=1 Tax=Arthrobotrys musiformis TaxID=47236 RepID=A0AAV9VXI7_9PEZI